MSETWDQAAAWLAARSERVIETSCARIYLAGDVAWKIKRPVSLGFLDFSTPAKRRWALDRELAFNQRWAGGVYRAVRTITRASDGFALDGDGEAVEWLLEMRRFDPDAVLANRPEIVDGPLAETLGRLIARGHMAAPAAPDGGGTRALGYTIATNEDSLRRTSDRLGRAAVERLIEATRAALGALAPLLEARRVEGFARHCHGDLHLGNILLEDGAPVLFDCIEFNDRLSRIDVLYDAAFPIMDLVVRDRPDAANRLLNAWLDEAARGFPPSLWAGLAALPLFLATRAAVRAHVTASTGEGDLARRYLAAAEDWLKPAAPRLVAVGGRSGTGKTSFARALAPLMAGAPGAVVPRSDEIRKRLMGVGPLDPLPAAAYASEVDERVYADMLDVAASVLGAGRSVILDATFLAPETRERAAEVGAKLSVPFEGLWLEGDPDALRARVTARRSDSSDADVAVLEGQLARDEGPMTWRRLSIDSNLNGAARELAGAR